MISVLQQPDCGTNTARRARSTQQPVDGHPRPLRGTLGPLRGTLVTETFVPEVNGVAMTLSRLMSGMRERGHQMDIVRPRMPRDYPDGCDVAVPLPTINRPGLAIPNYPLMRIGMPSLTTLRATWRRQPPDVVHIATEGPMGLSALIAARSLGIPCTSSFHTNFDQYTAHYHFGFLRPTVAGYLRWVHNRSACTMVPTLSQARSLQAEGYRRVRILSRGLDERLFHPDRRRETLRQRWGAGPDTLVCCVVGRLAAEKNLGLALAALDAIRAERPDSVLLLVGDGPERAHLQQHPGVICAGMQCDCELAEHYASADLFLFPSMTETYGNVLVEAMACGLACVAFDYAAAEELVVDGSNGLAVPFGDTDAFIAAARRAANDATLRRRLGHAAVAVTRSRRWNRVVAAFERYLYDACRKPFDREISS